MEGKTASKSPDGKCMCGCGQTVSRRFLPGHDARHKGNLLNAATDPGGTDASRKAATDALSGLGWGAYVTKRLESLAAKEARSAKKKAEKASSKAKAAASPNGGTGAESVTESPGVATAGTGKASTTPDPKPAKSRGRKS